jgi:hypothetical protein
LSSQFSIIQEEFDDDLESIRALIGVVTDPSKPQMRIAAANSATLLLAATFEQFVREMARTYARAIVAAARDFKSVPKKLVQTAWRRTMAGLVEVEVSAAPFAEGSRKDALRKFNSVYQFCNGDKTQDIYEQLIHNENNMRPAQINLLFSISDMQDICLQTSDKAPILQYLQETDANKAHGLILNYINDFFERRNEIAHALGTRHSSGSDQILKDVDFFLAFSISIARTLEDKLDGMRVASAVDRVFVFDLNGYIFEVHSVGLRTKASDYLKQLREFHRARGKTFQYKVELKNGTEFSVT